MAHESYNEAVYDVVHNPKTKIPPKQLADRLNIAESTLYNCANPNMDEPKLPRKHIIPITNLTDNYAILDYMEQACGRVAFRIPKVSGPVSAVTREVSDATKSFGALLEKVGEALSNDDKVDAGEFVNIRDAAMDMITQIVELMTAAEVEAKRGA